MSLSTLLAGHFGIFFVFSAPGRGRGSPGRQGGGGVGFLLKMRGGSPRTGWEGGRGREGVCREFGGIGGGGGLNIFFGAEMPAKIKTCIEAPLVLHVPPWSLCSSKIHQNFDASLKIWCSTAGSI